jgi:hypothetical protein
MEEREDKMEPYVAETREDHKFKLEIINDLDPLNPRTDFDNMFTMVCWHSRYNLGDKHEFKNPGDFLVGVLGELSGNWQRGIAKFDGIIKPLFLYDHSGITISTGDFGDKWDSGQVGWIYCTKENARKEMMAKRLTKKVMAQVLKNLECEVEIYDQYLTGDVWGYEVESHDGVYEDSCWGFFGSDPKKNGMWDHWSEEIRKLYDPQYVQNPNGHWIDKQLELELEVA